MAKESDFDQRRRQREKEEARREESESLNHRKGDAVATTGDPGSTQKLVELIERADPLIEQLNNLYNQYVTGVESRPPRERRLQLDQLMSTLQLMNKPTPAYQFRYNTMNAKYLTHRDRWDRLCKDLESGKIKRVTGPRGGG